MGNLESPYGQVTAFYNYWLGFSTVMDFVWVDEYDVMAGPNRKLRRVMEEENKKLRRKAKREYNDTVRGLAEFVKKRDKRVIDMSLKRKEETERRKEEERVRKKKMEKERLERVRAYEEPEWAKVEEEEEGDDWDEMEGKGGEKEELYCVACGKKFKSEKQWKNHEQSKKHKEKVAELRESFIDEEEEVEDLEVEEDVEDRLREGLRIEEEEEDKGENRVDEMSEEDDGFFDVEEGGEEVVEVDSDNHDDEENSVLEAMVSGKKDKNASFKSEDVVSHKGFHVKDDSDEVEYMEYDKRKNRRRNKRGKKERGKKNGSDDMKSDVNEMKSKDEEASVSDSLTADEKQPIENKGSNGEKDDKLGNNEKILKQPVERKGNMKKETRTKSNNSSKGKKVKATAKHSGNVCETCGEEFQSKNKLYKHLGDTGHATLKFR